MISKKIRLAPSVFDSLVKVMTSGVFEEDRVQIDLRGVKSFNPDWNTGRLVLSPPGKLRVRAIVTVKTTITSITFSKDEIFVEIDNSPVDLKFVRMTDT